MSSNLGWVELRVHTTSVLSSACTKNILGVSALHWYLTLHPMFEKLSGHLRMSLIKPLHLDTVFEWGNAEWGLWSSA